jgi:Tol biopolymer transport system component
MAICLNVSGSQLVQSDEPWLAAYSWDIPLWNDSYSLLPVELFAGNTDRTGLPGDPGSESEDVEWDDFLAVTTTYGIPQLLPYDGGDANGDRKVNETDLALVGGRYYEDEYTWADHLLYDLSTDWDSDWNSHIRYGVVSESATTLISDVKTKDYWATMSPDGSKIAFIRYDEKADRYRLYTGTYAKGKLSAKVLTPKSFKGDAMAPSWSPDGSQIAFHCSPDVWYDDDWGIERKSQWLRDNGRLCLINANGTGFDELGGTWNARVYPPTWFNNHVIFFGGNHWDGDCADSICYKDLDRNDTEPVSPLLDFTGGDDIADMPVLRTDSSGDMHLFYRYTSRTISYGTGPDNNDEITINSRNIRYVDWITYDGDDFTLSGVGSTITFYEEPGGAVFVMTDVEYYNVERSWGKHIIGYGREFYDRDEWWYGDDFFVSWFDWGGTDEWDSTWYRSVDRQNGFDTVDKRDWDKCGHNRWDPYEPECESFGLRNTAELLP